MSAQSESKDSGRQLSAYGFTQLTNVMLVFSSAKTVLLLTLAALFCSAVYGVDAATAPAPTGNALRGKNLFIGGSRFVNRGPTCNSCHNVDMPGVLSGGGLAKDLTHVYSRLGESGIRGVVSGLPFPQMKGTYESHQITDREITDLIAFLKEADEQPPAKHTLSISDKVLIGGMIGVSAFFILISYFWYRRKSYAVNDTIYDRQISSN